MFNIILDTTEYVSIFQVLKKQNRIVVAANVVTATVEALKMARHGGDDYIAGNSGIEW